MITITKYKLILEIELLYVSRLFYFSLIYFSIIVLLLAKGYYLKGEIELLISYRILYFFYFTLPAWLKFNYPESLASLYLEFKQYLILYLPLWVQFYCPESLVPFYLEFKQYLIMQEFEKHLQEAKNINLETVDAEFKIKLLKNEIQTLQKSSEVSQKMMLPDTADVESKLNERRAAIESDRIFRRNFFWIVVGSSVIFEAIVLWHTW